MTAIYVNIFIFISVCICTHTHVKDQKIVFIVKYNNNRK